jgi:hypothetical protein
VLGSVVDGVDTDRVDAELLELLDVTLAASSIGDGILSIGSTTCGMLVVGMSVSCGRTCLAGSRHRGCRNACRLRRKLHVISINSLHVSDSQVSPFPLTVTGVMDARFWTAAGEAATVAARTAAIAPDFIVTR